MYKKILTMVVAFITAIGIYLVRGGSDSSVDDISAKFWSSRDGKSWDYQKIFPDRAEAQKKYLLEEFVPRISKNSELIEFAVADGTMGALVVAPFVSHIDGFDISEGLIKDGMKKAEQLNITNVSFNHFDLRQGMNLTRTYDNALMLGLLTCIENTEDANNIVKQLKDSIKSGGLVALKDTISNSASFGSKNSRYAAYYRSKKEYLDLFTDNGFTKIYENNISGLSDKTTSYFFIMQKI